MNPNDLEAEFRRRQNDAAAQFVKNEYKDKQRGLWQKTMGMKVFDLVEFTDLKTGEDIVLQVYSNVKTSDLAEGERVICQAYLLSLRETKVFFIEGLFSKGSIWDSKGEKIIPQLQNGGYTVL